MVNHMFMQRTITTPQKYGVILCLPKTSGAQRPAEYRSITLLNTDYKLLARIIAHRLRPVMEEHLKTSQFCGVPGYTIYEAVATVREAIAQAEIKHKLLCVLPLDFQEAFDKISHHYLFTILKSYRPYKGHVRERNSVRPNQRACNRAHSDPVCCQEGLPDDYGTL
jgi:hypothetical protein